MDAYIAVWVEKLKGKPLAETPHPKDGRAQTKRSRDAEGQASRGKSVRVY